MRHRELRSQESENKLSSRQVTDTVNHLIARGNEQDDYLQ